MPDRQESRSSFLIAAAGHGMARGTERDGQSPVLRCQLLCRPAFGTSASTLALPWTMPRDAHGASGSNGLLSHQEGAALREACPGLRGPDKG